MQKYNMFIAQIVCAAVGVLAFFIFGPGWLAIFGTGLAAAIAFIIYTRSIHPPDKPPTNSLFPTYSSACFLFPPHILELE